MTTVTARAFAERHRVVLTAEMLDSWSAPCTPTGEYQLWRWSAITERGVIELEGETDGSGAHDAFTRLFGWWKDIAPDGDELAHALDVLGPAALAELLQLIS